METRQSKYRASSHPRRMKNGRYPDDFKAEVVRVVDNKMRQGMKFDAACRATAEALGLPNKEGPRQWWLKAQKGAPKNSGRSHAAAAKVAEVEAEQPKPVEEQPWNRGPERTLTDLSAEYERLKTEIVERGVRLTEVAEEIKGRLS